MRFLATSDPRLFITPTIQEMGITDALGAFYQQSYREDTPVYIVHKRDLYTAAPGRSPYAPPGTFYPYNVRELAVASLTADPLPYVNMMRRAFVAALLPPQQLSAHREEDEFTARVRRRLARSNAHVTRAEANSYVIALNDEPKGAVFHKGLDIADNLVNDEKVAGSDRDWQAMTIFHESGHVFDGLPETQTRQQSAAGECSADGHAFNMYDRARNEFGVDLDPGVPAQWRMWRQAILLSQSFSAKIHFPGGHEMADILRGPFSQAAIDGYDRVWKTLLDGDPIRHPLNALLTTEMYSQAENANEWVKFWMDQCRQGWQDLIDCGVLRTRAPRHP